MGYGCTSLLEFSVFACLELGWEGRGRLDEGAGRPCIVRIDSLFLCSAFTIMKFELRSEESRTIIISLASVCVTVWLSTLAPEDIEMFLCLSGVLCRVITSFHPLVLRQRSDPSFHSLDFKLVPKRLGFILAHPPDASQGRHAPHTEQTNCPSPMPCRRRSFHDDLSVQQC